MPGDYGDVLQKSLACSLVIIAALIHSRNRRASGQFQFGFTTIKIITILGFCLAGLLLTPNPQDIHILPQKSDWTVLSSGAFAIALIYVSYAYTGWNAATYIIGELETPQRDLPRILILSTAAVMLLYVLLNFTFLYVAPMDALQAEGGKVEIGYIAAGYIFPDFGARLAGIMLALLLISTVSAMTLAGPRALQVIGEDFKALAFLGRTNPAGIPRNAIYFQSGLALLYILTSSFQTIVVFTGAILALNSFLAILGVFVLRYKEPDLPRPYKSWGYPVVPLIYLIITGSMLGFIIITDPLKASAGLVLIIAGLIAYRLSQ